VQSRRSRESIALASLRLIFSPVVRACYGFLNRNLRARVCRIPGVFPVYRRLLKPAGGGNEREFAVETVKSDDFFAKEPVQPQLVKMDIEGAEADALEGTRNLLKSGPEIVLVVELNSDYLCVETVARLMEELDRMGFGFAAVHDEESRVQAGSPKEVERRFAKLHLRIHYKPAGGEGEGLVGSTCWENRLVLMDERSQRFVIWH
jgi:hypothetical protein